MEGLVLLIAEVLVVLLAPLVAVLAGLVATAISLLVALLAALLSRLSFAWTPAAPSPQTRRRVLWTSLSLAGILLVGWLLAEFVFFQSVIKAAAERITAKAGIEVRYQSAKGSLTTGRLLLSGVSLSRGNPEQDGFDLRIDELDIDARVLSLFGGEPAFDWIRLRGVRGRYDRRSGIERKPRKPFTADVLELSDVDLDWVLHRKDRADWKVPLRVERLQVRPFEAANAALCILFRSNGTGAISGAPWAITMEGGGDGRRTTWTADAVPVELLSAFIGGPFEWFSGGTVDVRVHDSWRRGEKTEVDLRWRLVFRDLKVEVPARVEGLRRTFGEAVASLARLHPKELPLELTMTLDERGFQGRMSLEALELWDAFAVGLIQEFASRSGLAAETVRAIGRSAWGTLKGWLERKARNP